MSYTKTFTVNEKREDYQRHVNNLRYLEWFIDTAVEHAEQMGWGMTSCKKMGLAWVAISHQIEYKRPAYQGEKLRIQTSIVKVTPVRITRHYACYRGDTLLCEAQSVWVLVDYEGEKPRALPKALKTTFEEICGA